MVAITVPLTLSLVGPVVSEMKRRGWSCLVVTSPPQSAHERSLCKEYDAVFMPMTRAITPLNDARALAAWVRLLRKTRPDLVIGSTPKAALLSMIAARITGIPVRVFQVRGARWDGMAGMRGQLLRRLDRLTADCATDVIAVSDSLADLFVEKGATRNRPLVIGAGSSKGVDVVRFHAASRPPDRPFTLGFIGRLAEDKGISDLLTVFERCRSEDPTTTLIVVGEIDDAQPITKSTIRRLGQDGVIWPGVVEDVVPWMQSIDVLVFPSSREGLPNVVIEAAACGVPTVAYRATGVVDSVDDGHTGILVRLGDVDALTASTIALMNDHLRSRMSRKARACAVDRFDQADVIDGFLDHAERLLTSRR